MHPIFTSLCPDSKPRQVFQHIAQFAKRVVMNPAQDALKSVLLKLNELLQLSIENSSGAEQKVSSAVVQLISMVTTASHAVRMHHQEQAEIQQKLAACVTELEKISRAQGKELKRLSSRSFHSMECNTEPIFCSSCASKDATIKVCSEQLSIARDSVTDLTHKLRVSKTLLQAQQVMLAERNGSRSDAVVRGDDSKSAREAHPEPQAWRDIFSAPSAQLAAPAERERHTTQLPTTTHEPQSIAPYVPASGLRAAGTGLARPPLPPGAAPPHRYRDRGGEQEEEEDPELLEDEESGGDNMYLHDEHDEEELQNEDMLDESGREQGHEDDRHDDEGEEPRRYPHPHSPGPYSSRQRWETRAGGYNPGGLEVDVSGGHGDAGQPGRYRYQHAQESYSSSGAAAQRHSRGDWEPTDPHVASQPGGFEAHDSCDSYGSLSSAEEASPGAEWDRGGGDVDLSLSGGSGRSWAGQGTPAVEAGHGKVDDSGEYEEEEYGGGDQEHDEDASEDFDCVRDEGGVGLRAPGRGSSWADAVQGGTEDSFAMVQNYYSLEGAF